MSRRLYRFGLLLTCLIVSEVWALGLGEIRLDSALNEPLRAEIELLSATAEELENLRINLASTETFDRYGIDRPVFLTRLDFSVEGSGSSAVVRVTSQEPITEPFVTFLIEAVWSRGRLLREYTVLLDPPTFAPPPSRPTTEAVTAPTQTTQADRGQIERPAQPAPTPAPARPAPRPAPAPAPAPAPVESAPAAVATDFDTTSGGDYQVRRGDTLWRIAEEVRPDARLTMNQTMLAIYEANPNAFAGNINRLRANSRLSIPSADEIFRISRGTALSEIRRQNQRWRGDAPTAASTPQPTLTLVPPDAEQTPYQGSATRDTETAPAATADSGSQDRIRQLEERIAEQQSLLEIRDSELARLRSELQRLRDERAADAAAGDAVTAVGDDEPVAVPDAADDEPAADTTAAEQPAPAADTQPPAPRITTAPPSRDEGIIGTITGFLTGIWGLIGIGLLAVVGVLLWFARRASGTSVDAEDTGTWEALGADDEADAESVASTQRLRAMAREDDTSIVVVEQAGGDTISSESAELTGLDVPPPEEAPATPPPVVEPEADDTAEPVSLEDTFSSETAINLDQTDPIAEADFHMAYGLYDQAADLVNGALSVEPERTDLMAKLCEIYFVWGNRESFITAANSLKSALGDGPSREWDKIVIMGQQIASDDPLFDEVTPAVGGAAAVDLDFAGDDDDAGLDIDFAGDELAEEVDPDSSIIIDLGAEESIDAAATGVEDVLDFTLDDEDVEDDAAAKTREMPRGDEAAGDETVESPTVEQPGPGQATDRTTELPIARDDVDAKLSELGEADDSTAEIDLDDLGLDLGALGGDNDSDLEATGTPDELEDTTAGDKLLDATGLTQVLPDEETVADEDIGDDDATVLGPGLGGDSRPDFDFAATEALSSDALEKASDDLAATAETPNLAATEMELDIDDLTAALKLSDAGDTIEQKRDDDATVEQPLGADYDATQEIGPDNVSSDLQEARTMTEVGTKLDLARAYVDMGDPGGARNILEEVLEEGDESQRQEAQQLLDSLPS